MNDRFRYTVAMKQALLASLALSLWACGEDFEVPDEVPTTGQRVTLPNINFNLWVDYLTLQGAVDETCHWMWPVIDDHSTPFPPLQGFWVIYENPNDVRDGTLIEGTFFEGDRLEASDFPAKDGLDPLGFAFTTPLQQAFLDIESTEILDEGRTLIADFGKPIESMLRLSTSPTGTTCLVTAETCDDPCDGTWTPLDHVMLELGFLYTVQSVELVPLSD